MTKKISLHESKLSHEQKTLGVNQSALSAWPNAAKTLEKQGGMQESRVKELDGSGLVPRDRLQ